MNDNGRLPRSLRKRLDFIQECQKRAEKSGFMGLVASFGELMEQEQIWHEQRERLNFEGRM